MYLVSSLGSQSLHSLGQTLEGLSPYPSLNLLNDYVIDVGLLVSITYDCLSSKETSLYTSHNSYVEDLDQRDVSINHVVLNFVYGVHPYNT